MAVKKVREAAAKRLLKLYGGKFFASLRPATVTGLDFAAGMDREFPSGDGARLVVKPDCLFGKRGKHDLVGLDLSVEEAKAFIQARSGKRVEVDGCAGVVDTFIVEPFVPHADEFYMSIASERLGLTVSFSDMGGIEVRASVRACERRPSVHQSVSQSVSPIVTLLTLSSSSPSPPLPSHPSPHCPLPSPAIDRGELGPRQERVPPDGRGAVRGAPRLPLHAGGRRPPPQAARLCVRVPCGI